MEAHLWEAASGTEVVSWTPAGKGTGLGLLRALTHAAVSAGTTSSSSGIPRPSAVPHIQQALHMCFVNELREGARDKTASDTGLLVLLSYYSETEGMTPRVPDTCPCAYGGTLPRLLCLPDSQPLKACLARPQALGFGRNG